jgi:hypothetical protein
MIKALKKVEYVHILFRWSLRYAYTVQCTEHKKFNKVYLGHTHTIFSIRSLIPHTAYELIS